MAEPEAYTAFTKTLSKADDALEQVAGGRADRQWHLEQLVGAGWRLVDHIDSGHVIVKLDVDTLAQIIREARDRDPQMGAHPLAEAILAEIGGA